MTDVKIDPVNGMVLSATEDNADSAGSGDRETRDGEHDEKE